MKENRTKHHEAALTAFAREICATIGIGLADWDFDQVLRTAIETHPDLEEVLPNAELYDKLIEIADLNFIQIDRKFEILYKLGQN